MTKSHMPKSRRTSSRRQRGQRAASSYVDPATVRYNGPITDTRADTLIALLPVNASVSSDVIGAISGTFNNNPSSAVNWTEYSTAWGEYRVLGIKCTYIPQYSANTTVIGGFSGYHGIIHGLGAFAPTTLAEASATGVARLWYPFRPFVREWRMSSVEEAAWVSTAGPAATSNALSLYGQGATASTLYGNTLLEYLIQFRSHRK
jgi:hypothetical protein